MSINSSKSNNKMAPIKTISTENSSIINNSNNNNSNNNNSNNSNNSNSNIIDEKSIINTKSAPLISESMIEIPKSSTTTTTTPTNDINGKSNKISILSAPPLPPLPPLPPPPPIKNKINNGNSSNNSNSSIISSKFNNNLNISTKLLLEGFKRDSLNKTKTKVRMSDGRVFEEELSSSGHNIVYKGLDESTSIKIYKETTNLTAFNYCKKFKQWIPYTHIENIIPTENNNYINSSSNNNSNNSNNNLDTINNSNNNSNFKILTYITFNVWFDSFLWKERAKQLFKLIQDKNPDIICLQEVTPLFLDYLKVQDWVKESYCLSDNGDLDSVYPYGVVVLFKYDTVVLKQMSLCPLPNTNQSRKMISSIFSIHHETNNNNNNGNSNNNNCNDSNNSNNDSNNNNDILISISTVHLESLDSNSESRIKQFNMVSDFIDKRYIVFNGCPIKHHFIMGDFNFGSNSIENFEISKREFNDIWKEFNINDPEGYTYVKKTKRVDRMIFKSSKGTLYDSTPIQSQLKPLQLSLIGFEPLELDSSIRKNENIPLEEPVYASDHYGLLGKFKFIINNNHK